MTDDAKFELKVFVVVAGKWTNIIIRGQLRKLDLHNEHIEYEPVIGHTQYTLHGQEIRLEGRARPWEWHQGKPTWAEDIPEEEEHPVRVPWLFRSRRSSPKDQDRMER